MVSTVDDVYLSVFWGMNVGDKCIKRGQFNLDSCGGPSDWTLGDQSNLPNCLWSVKYEEKRYVYVFEAYENDPPSKLKFFDKLAEIGVKIEDVICVAENLDVYVYQTDSLFPGWDTKTGLWDDISPDDLGGLLNVIDTQEFTTEPWTSPIEKVKKRVKEVREKELELFDLSVLLQ